MATLSVLKFSTADGAQQMESTLLNLQKQHLIEVQDAAIVTWPQGKKSPKTQQQLAYQQAQIEQMQAQLAAPQPVAQPPAAPVPAPAPAGNDLTTKLNQLAQLHASGVLSDEEFSAAKQKVLAGG